MKLKYILNYMLSMFSIIISAQVVYIALIGIIRPTNHADFTMYDLQTIVLRAAVGVIPIIIFYLTTQVSRKIYFLIVVPSHLITTLTAVLTVHIWRTEATRSQLFIPVPLFIVLYIGLHIRAERRNKRAIEELNRRINATH